MKNKTVYLVRTIDRIKHPLNGRQVERGEFLLLYRELDDAKKFGSKHFDNQQIGAHRDISWDEVLRQNLFTSLDISIDLESAAKNFEVTIKLGEGLKREGYSFITPVKGYKPASLIAVGIAIIEGKIRRSPDSFVRIDKYIKKLKGTKDEITFDFHGGRTNNDGDDTFFRYKLFLEHKNDPGVVSLYIDPIIRNDGSKRP